MKKGAIFIIFIIVFSNIVIAKEVSIPQLFEVENQIISENLGKEVYYYAGSKLIAVNEAYEYQGRLGSDFNSRSLPFGQPLNIKNRFSFTGKEFDKDLYYFNARYYDSNLGKFTSVDPVKDNHAYAYVENNPMNYIDPTGMDDMFGTADMMLDYEQSSPEYKAAFKKGFFGGSLTAADFYPIIGDAKGFFDAARGRDQYGPLNFGEKMLCLFCLSEIKTGAKLRHVPKLLDLAKLGANSPLKYVIEAAQNLPGQKVFREIMWQGSSITTSIKKRDAGLGIYLTRHLGDVSESAKGMESVIHLQVDELGKIDLFKYGTNVLESGRGAKTRTIVDELVGTNIADLGKNMERIGNVGGDLDPKLFDLVKNTFPQ
jgi:RHS repeat-associated protein